MLHTLTLIYLKRWIMTETRFEKLEAKLKKRGAKNPGALAAWIGRNKYGEKKMEEMSEEGKEHKEENNE